MKLNKRGDRRGMVRKIVGEKGSKNKNWKGGIHTRKDGYILVRKGVIKRKEKGARYVLLHRLIMEKHLGRRLKQSEIVHHKDGDKSNNDINNLEVMSQKEHAKIHIVKDKKTGRIISTINK